MSSPTTPSQTVGPFFAIGLPWEGGPLAIAGGLAGIALNSRAERTRCVAESGVRWNA